MREKSTAAGEEGADGVEAVGAGEQRLARLPLASPRAAASGQSRLGDVGEVGENQVEAPRPLGSVPSRKRTRSARPRRAALARATSSAAGEVSVAVTSQPGSSSATARAIAPEPVPTSSSVAGARSSASFDQQLGLRPRHQHPPVDRQLEVAETLCGRRCRRPARAATAAAPSRRTAAPPAAGTSASGSATSAARSQPIASASSTSASSRGSSTPAARSAVDRGAQRLANVGHANRCVQPSRRRPRPPAAAASPRPRARR